MSGKNTTAAFVTQMEGDLDGKWPNHQVDSLGGVRSTPWEEPSPTMAWNYPSSAYGGEMPQNPHPGHWSPFNPQGFVFTLAGSREGVEGFADGPGPDAR